MSHLYGVFPTHGFPNDTFFPSTYSIGEVVLENSGCAVNNKVCNTIKCFDLAKKQRNLRQNIVSPVIACLLGFCFSDKQCWLFLMRDSVLFRGPASSGESVGVVMRNKRCSVDNAVKAWLAHIAIVEMDPNFFPATPMRFLYVFKYRFCCQKRFSATNSMSHF